MKLMKAGADGPFYTGNAIPARAIRGDNGDIAGVVISGRNEGGQQEMLISLDIIEVQRLTDFLTAALESRKGIEMKFDTIGTAFCVVGGLVNIFGIVQGWAYLLGFILG